MTPALGPLVSIGCAVYNGEATLPRALAPLVAQDYPNIEILISDDGSTDGSRAIFEGFARKDPRIRVLENDRNLGITQNFNHLFRASRGKYFMWADQDDIRDVTFVSRTVAALEANPDAVLCHSHTGVFMGNPDDVKYVVTLFGVADVNSRPLRYFRFLRYFSDTTIYGLIRSEALRETSLWRNDLGSANGLLFAPLLRGRFIEIPQTLYYYSARGIRNRPTPKQDYARSNPGKTMPAFYFPFLVLARNQTVSILSSPVNALEKLGIASILWGHTSVVAVTKLAYRALASRLGEPPEWFTTACDSVVEPRAHLEFLNDSDRDEHLFPKHWNLKGGA